MILWLKIDLILWLSFNWFLAVNKNDFFLKSIDLKV